MYHFASRQNTSNEDEAIEALEDFDSAEQPGSAQELRALRFAATVEQHEHARAASAGKRLVHGRKTLRTQTIDLWEGGREYGQSGKRQPWPVHRSPRGRKERRAGDS